MESIQAERFVELANNPSRLLVRAHIHNMTKFHPRAIVPDLHIEVWMVVRGAPDELYGLQYEANNRSRIRRYGSLVREWSSESMSSLAASTLVLWGQKYPRWLQDRPEVVTYQDNKSLWEEDITGWLLFAHLMQMRAAIDLKVLGREISHESSDRLKLAAGRLDGLINELYQERRAATRAV
jgi:hypothetical protein